MSVREVQEIKFDSIINYLDWYAEQYHNQTGVKVCGLKENGEGMIAEYIKLF
jgi:hypothetical protein